MSSIEFYNTKSKSKETVAIASCNKTTVVKGNRTTRLVKATSPTTGTTLTKIVGAAMYDELDIPVI